MKQMLITLFITIALTSCQDQETEAKRQAEHDAKIAAEARAQLLKELAEKKAHSKESEHYQQLHEMGIDIKKDIISIDTNKSKLFFKNFSEKMAKQIQKASEELEKGVIDSKEAGVEINDESIHIDLNKTKHFFEEWSKHIKSLTDEINQASKQFENNTSH